MTTLALERTRLPDTTRVRVLRILATRWLELIDPMQARGKTGDGTHVPLMPDAWRHPTVREFDRLMTEMRIDRHRSLIDLPSHERVSVRKLHWHLRAWYVDPTHTVRHVPIQLRRGQKLALIRDQDGNAITTRPIVRTFRTQGARQDLADAGLEWIAEAWAIPSEPMLPDELREAVA